MYVIQSIITFTNKKTGLPWEDKSYFQSHNNTILPFNIMTGQINEAKKYEFKTEAHREKRKYFGNSKKVSVIKISE